MKLISVYKVFPLPVPVHQAHILIATFHNYELGWKKLQIADTIPMEENDRSYNSMNSFVRVSRTNSSQTAISYATAQYI